jgi:hypothetical protein
VRQAMETGARHVPQPRVQRTFAAGAAAHVG